MSWCRAVAVGVLLLSGATSARAEDGLEEPGRLAAVQKRRFRLDHEIAASGALLPWDAFYKGLAPVVGYTFHLDDSFGWEVVRGGYSFNLSTGLRDQLVNEFQVDTTRFDEVKALLGSAIVVRPLYGKMSFFNRRVLHGEIFTLAGATLASFSGGTFKPGPQVGLGGRVFLNEWISLRVETRYHLLISDKLSHVVEVSSGLAFNLGGAD